MRVVRIKKFLEEKDSVEWLIEGLLPNVGWTLFYGLKGIGKTTFAMQLCAALQSGTPFMGRKVQKTDILYFQADSVEIEWKEILKRIAKDVKGVTDGFTAVSVPRQALSNPTYVESMTKAIEMFKPGFVVFDSLYNLSAYKINTEKILGDVNAMYDMCVTADGRPLPWLVIHHPPHGESRAAGHHSLGGNCSNEWSLLKTKLSIEKGRLVADKEILMKRNGNGIWELYKSATKHDPILDKEW